MYKLKSMFYVTSLFGLLIFMPAAFASMVPASGHLNFDVMRKGDKIGSQSIVFGRKDGALNVNIKTRIAVKVLFVTVYRYEADIRETWRGGKLVSMQAATNDDGTKHQLTVISDGKGHLNINGDGKRRSLPDTYIPASLWNSSYITSGKLMSGKNGAPLKVKVKLIGKERIKSQGRTIEAKHYAMTGDFANEVWYDSNKVLVQQKFKGSDGSIATYVLK